jgi:hypothetical protein
MGLAAGVRADPRMSFGFQRVGRFLWEVFTILCRMWPYVLMVFLLFAAAFFWVEIDPAREHGFGAGILHGFFGVQNLVLSWFTEREVWAPVNTGRGYTAGFWIGLFVVPFLVRNTLGAVIFILRQRYSKVP